MAQKIWTSTKNFGTCKKDKALDNIQTTFFLWGIKNVRMSWSFRMFHEFQIKQMLKNSVFYLDKQKVFSPKKIWSVPNQVSRTVLLVPWRPNFPNPRLWLTLKRIIVNTYILRKKPSSCFVRLAITNVYLSFFPIAALYFQKG